MAADGSVAVEVKIRARHPGVGARVRPLADGRVAVEFDLPQRGVAPGQAAVFYVGSRVLGGCWIEKGTARAEPRPVAAGDGAKTGKSLRRSGA